MSKSINAKFISFALIASAIFCSCTQNKPENKITVVGEDVDSVAIAQDTITQKGLESSYEFSKSISVSEMLVYDVIGYGGPASKGEYTILRRSANNKPDTVFHAQRFGIIVNAFKGDLNNNGKEEIYVVMRKPRQGASSYVAAVEFDKTGHASILNFGDSSKEFTISSFTAYDTVKPNSDTIEIHGNMITKSYVHDSKYSDDHLNHAWQLRENKFTLIHND